MPEVSGIESFASESHGNGTIACPKVPHFNPFYPTKVKSRPILRPAFLQLFIHSQFTETQVTRIDHGPGQIPGPRRTNTGCGDLLQSSPAQGGLNRR
jgi:hypothetical protein